MSREIRYLDKDRKDYESVYYNRDEVDEQLKGKTIINIETKKDFIRFWYNNEE